MHRSSHSTCTQRVVKQKSILVNHACLGVLHRLRGEARHCCDVGDIDVVGPMWMTLQGSPWLLRAKESRK
jgi:hypothetical protein